MKPLNRRKFIKKTAGIGAMTMLMPPLNLFKSMGTGLQLYTVRSLMSEDPAGTLKLLSEIGYSKVECAGYSGRTFYGMSPAKFREALESNGLTMPSGHYQTGLTMPDMEGSMTNGWLNAVKDAAEVGQQYMVLAYLHEEERTSMRDYEKLVPIIRDCATICKDYGIQFAYHNHDFEFMELDGVVPYDYLMAETDPGLVKMELDLFWTVKAGYDPTALFKEADGRFPLWHVKDMNDAGEFTEVGTGSINFKSIFKMAKKAGLEHFFVEQDRIQGDVKQSISTSFMNVQKII